MSNVEHVCEKVHERINQHKKRQNTVKTGLVCALVICLVGCASLSLPSLFQRLLPTLSCGGEETLNQILTEQDATGTCDGKKYTLMATAQAENDVYLLVETDAEEAGLADTVFRYRSGDAADSPGFYMGSNCGVIGYEKKNDSTLVLLHHIKTDFTSSALASLWVLTDSDSAQLLLKEENTVPARTIAPDSGIQWQDRQYEIETVSITPFCCILQTNSSEIPKEVYKGNGADVVLCDGTMLPCDVVWSMENSSAIITVMWNGILSIDDVDGLQVGENTLDFGLKDNTE